MKKTTITILAAIALPTQASTITIDATNSGWYNKHTFIADTYYGYQHNGDTYSMTAGGEFSDAYRNWLGFDLSSVDGTILSASLSIANHYLNDDGISFTWSEVSTDYSLLGAGAAYSYSAANELVYDDLGSGTVFASGITTSGAINEYFFNSDALISLNSTTSFWAIGGSATGDTGYSYAYTDGIYSSDIIQLTLEIEEPVIGEVPVPASIWLFGSGLTLIAGLFRRKSR